MRRASGLVLLSLLLAGCSSTGSMFGSSSSGSGSSNQSGFGDRIRNLFGGHNNPLGIGGSTPGAGGETVVNNYYDSNDPGASQADFVGNDDNGNDVDDASYDDDDSGPDDSYDV